MSVTAPHASPLQLLASQPRLPRPEDTQRMLGHSKEVNWALGGAALGLTVAIVEYIANNVFDR